MKYFPRLSVLPCLLAATAMVGCTYDCEDLCEDMRDCPGVDNSDYDCAEGCGQMEELADAADCSGDFDDYIDCIGGGDVCTMYEDVENPAEMECYSEAMSYGVCIMVYCDVDPAPSECDSYYDGD